GRLLFQFGPSGHPPVQNAESHFLAIPVDYGSGGVFQIFTVPSRLAEAIHSPSALKATLWTQLLWPCSVRISLVARFQTFTVESVPPQASIRLSLGWNATLCTRPVGSGRSRSNSQDLASQILIT